MVVSTLGHRRYALSRSFAGLALLAIVAIAGLSLWLLRDFVTQRMLWQEAILTRDFVQSLVRTEKPLQAMLAGTVRHPLPADAELALQHMAQVPDVLRCNVFDAERRLLWSSDPRRVGERFDASPDLAAALAGAVVINKKPRTEPQHGQVDTRPPRLDFYVEVYVPMRLDDQGPVLGVIEFYKHPKGLIALLDELQRYIALGALLSSALLFAAVFGLVVRADRLLERQQQQLVQAETFAAVGEMSSVVAHGIRNPLAVIRSSAELMLDAGGPHAHAANDSEQAARDIIEQSDRLDRWLKDLLAYTRPQEGPTQAVLLAPLLRAVAQELGPEADRRRVSLRVDDALPQAAVRGDALGIQQVLRTVVLNGIEATEAGGQVAMLLDEPSPAGPIRLRVADTGKGLDAAQLQRVGRAFHTTKPHGLGVGLALARRVLERLDARMEFHSAPGEGTTVNIEFPRA